MKYNWKTYLGLRYIAGFRLSDHRNELVPSSDQTAFANQSAFPGSREAFGAPSQPQKLSQKGKESDGY